MTLDMSLDLLDHRVSCRIFLHNYLFKYQTRQKYKNNVENLGILQMFDSVLCVLGGGDVGIELCSSKAVSRR